MKSILFAAMALTLGLSPMASNTARADESAAVAQIQQEVNATAQMVGETQIALDTAKVEGGQAFVKLYRHTFWGLVATTYAYQSSKGLLADSAWGTRVAQFGRDLGVNAKVMNHLTNYPNYVEKVAQIGNKVSPSKMTAGLLGDTSDRIVQFAARGGLRIAGYSFLAGASVIAATNAVYATGDGAAVLVLDAGVLPALRIKLAYARHELGEAVGNLAEASR